MSVQRFDPIAVGSESTVVAEYSQDERKATAYQSEAELERAFVRLLREQAYEYLSFTTEEELKRNLREQLEALNKYPFTDGEWERFFTASISGEKDGIVEKTRRIQEDHIQVLKRDNGETKNIYLLDKQNIHNNKLQVINQYEAEGERSNRYDVTVLVNGLPLVHIELKRRGVDIREAFNQINRYQRDTFWAGSGLFQYVQLFVISNGTYTKYYSNTVREQHIKEASGSTRSKKTSNSYEFTSWWADANNTPIFDLMAFGKTFFAKHSLLNVLTKYCVFTVEQSLLVMRPYQIVATERILQRIVTSQNAKNLGTIGAGGYVWHTTGSGKTLTSFKAAQLASRLPEIDKVLFVVDRKDLDFQTMKEYDRFEKGAASSNQSTTVLKSQLEDRDSRIIITTIQKLSIFIKKNPKHEVAKKRVVLIFDECHRSQFGDMHREIRKAFSNYNLFGFTGTPIFAANSMAGGDPNLRTTEQAFGDKLHTYTIVDAIRDKNVLPFRVDYVNTFKLPEGLSDKQVRAIDTEKALLAPERIKKVVSYVLDHFDQKTRRNETYNLSDRRVSGFNSIFATQSIEAAKRYYLAFKEAQSELPAEKRLKISTIYSFAANEDDPDGLLAEEGFEVEALDKSSRDFLEQAIRDYNEMFSQSYSTSSDGFENYYKDLTKRLKSRELDMVIVVNMFLTGFDATTLNTLWVDKNLRQHGLLQAFSRTNRILNSVKTYGNIVCFRDLEKQTTEAISLFGNKEAGGIVLLKPYAEYYDEYSKLISELLSRFTPGALPVGEQAQKEFIQLFNGVLRLTNILTSFDEFAGEKIISDAQNQDYRSTYFELRNQIQPKIDEGKESILDDVVFELELVRQVEINVDYILMMVRSLQEKDGDTSADKEIRVAIERAVDSSYSLRSKKDLIQKFVESINVETDVETYWARFVAEQRQMELEQIIEDERLDPALAHVLMEQAFKTGELSLEGSAISRVVPAVSMFSPQGDYSLQKRRVFERLSAFFERFHLLG
jgi:type I restriction enzyme, R subunit